MTSPISSASKYADLARHDLAMTSTEARLSKQNHDAPRLQQSFDSRNFSEGRSCADTGFFGHVLVPFTLDYLPESESLAGRALNHLTNVYSFFDTVQEDLCDGRLGEDGARAAAESVARGAASAASLVVGAKLTLLGSVFGPVGTAGGVATTAFLLRVAPDVSAKIVDVGFNLYQDFIGRTAEYVKSVRGW